MNKGLSRVIILCFAMTQMLLAAPKAPISKPWAPGKYHGLVMGKSTRTDTIRILGKPTWSGKEQDTGAPILNFEVSDPVQGSLTVYLNHGIVESVALAPKQKLNTSDIVRLFGSGYKVVHYDVDECLDDGGAAPIYESLNGPVKHFEYRGHGLAAIFKYQNEDEVEAIVYTFKPFGPTASRCKGRKDKR